MKTSFLIIGCALSLLFALDKKDSWTVVLEQENLTTAAVEHSEHSSTEIFYYAVKEKGVFRKDTLGAKMLTGETDEEQPSELLNTTTMIISNQDILPTYLYAATAEKLFTFGVKGKGPYNWKEVYSAEAVEITEMVATTAGVFVLSADNRLFATTNDTLTEITLPDGAVTGFDIITPMAIGQERLVNSGSGEESAWVLFECSNGFLRQYMLFALPLEDATPISMGKSVQTNSTYLYGETTEFDFVKAITKGYKVDLQAYSQYLPTEGNIDLLFPSGTEISDIVLFDRLFPVFGNRLETYTPDILCITTSIGSYAIGLRELMEMGKTQATVADLDETIVLFDEIPATKAIHTPVTEFQNRQYVINEKGISLYTAPYASAVIPTQANSKMSDMRYSINKQQITLSLDSKESGTLSLLTLKGQKLTAVNFVHSNKVLLPTANNLAKGIYLLKLQTATGVITEKITIQ